MALIKRESNFNHRAISSVGAVGLTQIMPGTGIDLGMKPIFRPSYFNQAVKLLSQERKAEREALSTLKTIDKENGIKVAQRARKLMKKSFSLGKKREQLFSRYKVELLRRGKDSRLDPEESIEHGFIYFLKQMKAQNGDISLALASYNAGPHRVKKYQGIPPFDETVHFRNAVLSYYQDFSKRAEKQ
jgi:soluble lytic murein transglycosylase-like protein